MILTLVRKTFSQNSTIGDLLIDNVFECYTLEDRVRYGPKVYGQTAIPRGRYEVIVNWSDRFQRLLPLLLNVPNFSGIRIHAGNTAADTEGCILVGRTAGVDYIGQSRAALDALMPKISAAVGSGKVFIIVTGEQEA